MKRLTGKQQKRLEALADDKSLLNPDDVERFFAYTDRGDKEAMRGAGPDFYDLLQEHEHGVESYSWQQDAISDFKKGLLFLVEFDSARMAMKLAACACYLAAFGFETDHLRAWRQLWGLPNNEPPSEAALAIAANQRFERRRFEACMLK